MKSMPPTPPLSTELPLAVNPQQQQQLSAFVQLVLKWNQVYNLTAVHDINRLYTHHVADSLSVAAYIQGPRVLDFGTGAGFPGIPLAIALPQHEFILLDSNNKKVRFVTQAKLELGLKNVKVVHSRGEAYFPPEKVVTVITRAVGNISKLVPILQGFCEPGGQLLFMVGKINPEDHLIQGNITIIPLALPGLEEQRHLVRWPC